MPKQMIEVICPVCGRTMHKIIVSKKTTDKIEGQKEKYYDSISGVEGKLYLDYLKEKWDLNKEHWGIVRDCPGGRGSGFPIVDYLTERENSPVLFDKLKEQLLRGIAWWINREWISKEELIERIKDM